MVSIKQRALEALRKYKLERCYDIVSGHANVWAGPYLIGVDRAVGPDVAVVQHGTVMLPPYLRFGP